MKNKTPESNDFFARYRRARTFQYILPGFFGVFLALGLVSMSHTGDMRGLMASVAEVAQPQYDADIVMERTDTGVKFILGKDALEVGTISFRMMTNPSDNIVPTPSVWTVIDETEGVFQFVRSFGNQDVKAGAVIVEFSGITRDTPLALTDAEFVSGGVKYNLTSKGE